MVKKNTNFTLGLNRQELKEVAIKLGKTEQQVKKASTNTLQNFISKNITTEELSKLPNTKSYKILSKTKAEPKPKRTRKPYDTNFQLGVGREDLKRLAKDLGKKGNIGKSSTKDLEKFIQNQIIGKGKNIELTEPMKRDIKSMFELGYDKGKAYFSEKLSRVAKVAYEGDRAIKNEIAKQFSVFYEGTITDEIVSELYYNRLQYSTQSELWNGLKNTFAYEDTMQQYADELNNKENEDDL